MQQQEKNNSIVNNILQTLLQFYFQGFIILHFSMLSPQCVFARDRAEYIALIPIQTKVRTVLA